MMRLHFSQQKQGVHEGNGRTQMEMGWVMSARNQTFSSVRSLVPGRCIRLRVSRLMMTRVAAALSVPGCLKLSRIASRSTLTTGSGIFCYCSEAPLGWAMRYASISRDTHTCAITAATYKCRATNGTNNGCCLPTHRLPCQRLSLAAYQVFLTH